MADHIQIGNVAPRASHTGDGATVAFIYPFPIFDDADLEVYIDGALQTPISQYTVAGAGLSAGGTVAFSSAPSASADILFLRRLTISRTSDFQSSGEFRAKVINDELDFQTAVSQQINDDLGRTIRLQSTDAPASLELPGSTTRALKILSFDENGDVTTVAPSDLGDLAVISSEVPLAATTMGSSGSSYELSAADHRHPLPALSDLGIASQAEAEAGTDNTKAMTPLRTAQAISQLFAGVDSIARNMGASAFAYAVSTNDAVSITGNIGPFWLSDNFQSDSLVTSTDATYDTAGDYYHNPGEEVVSTTEYAGYVEHGHYSTLDGSGAFDGDTANSWTGSGGINASSGSHYVGVQLTDAFEVTKVRQWVAGNYTASAKVQYSDNGSSWADASGGTFSYDNQQGTWIEATLVSPGAHEYWRLISTSNSLGVGSTAAASNSWNVYELEFIAEGASADITLAPSGITLEAADPTDVIGYFVFEAIDSVTFGTDLIGKISIDGGTTTVTGTWTNIGDIGADGEVLWRLDADLSAQSGSSLSYEITTVNNKEIRLHDCVGLIAIY